MENDTFTDS